MQAICPFIGFQRWQRASASLPAISISQLKRPAVPKKEKPLTGDLKGFNPLRLCVYQLATPLIPTA